VEPLCCVLDEGGADQGEIAGRPIAERTRADLFHGAL